MTRTLLEKIKGLQYFRGLQDLRNILVEFLSTVTALETNSVIVGKIRLNAEVASIGTPFIPGKVYRVITLEPGDDFSNIGYVADDVLFIATGATPTSWTASDVVFEDFEIVPHFNDIDVNLTTDIQKIGAGNTQYFLKITNNKFIENKIYTSGLGDNLPIDNNTIEVVSTLTTDFTYFKIEVYN